LDFTEANNAKPMNRESASELERLADDISTHEIPLEIPVEHWDVMLVYLASTKFEADSQAMGTIYGKG
jgi:hypothetical protein